MGTTKRSNKSGTDDGKPKISQEGDSGETSPSPLSPEDFNILNQAGEIVREISPKIDTIERKIEKLEDKQDDQLNKIQEGRERVTETLAIFVALFTFISINFNFFSNKCLTPHIFIGLNLTLGGFLLIFVTLVRVRGSLSKKNSFEISLCFFSLVLILSGSGLVTLKSENYSRCQTSSESSNKQINQPKFEQNFVNIPESSSSATSQ